MGAQDADNTLQVATIRSNGKQIWTRRLIQIEERDVNRCRVIWNCAGSRFLYTLGRLSDGVLS